MFKKKPKPNGHIPQKPYPQGPSKKVRDDYIKKIRDIKKKKKPS